MTDKKKILNEIENLEKEGSNISKKSMYWVWIQNAKWHLSQDNFKLSLNDILRAREILRCA